MSLVSHARSVYRSFLVTPRLWRGIALVGWIPPLAGDLLIGWQTHPFTLFFPYLLACLWRCGPIYASLAMAATVICTGILDAGAHAGDPLLLIGWGEAIIIMVSLFLISARWRGYQLHQRQQELMRQTQDALRLRDEFLSAASHDLRSPLTTIKGQVDLLARHLERGDLDRAWLAKRVGPLQASVGRMIAVIGDITDVAQLQMGQSPDLRLESLDLREVVSSSVELARASRPPAAAPHIIYGAPDHPLMIEGDRMRLDRVLQNLLDNALKYSPHNTPIWVHLSDAQEGWILLTVEDQGIGIARADLPHIFERFYRAPNAVRVAGHRGGTGIGLAAVKRLVELHGGSIDVSSREGYGTTVVVWLPVDRMGRAPDAMPYAGGGKRTATEEQG